MREFYYHTDEERLLYEQQIKSSGGRIIEYIMQEDGTQKIIALDSDKVQDYEKKEAQEILTLHSINHFKILYKLIELMISKNIIQLSDFPADVQNFYSMIKTYVKKI